MSKTGNDIFGPIGPKLTAFANQHNLLIEKYWHQEPSWRFSFRHPRGGTGCLEVLAKEKATFMMSTFYWIDNYELGIRRARRTFLDAVDVTQVFDRLEESYTELLTWRPEDMDEFGDGFTEAWHRAYSKQEFYAFNEKYPVPC